MSVGAFFKPYGRYSLCSYPYLLAIKVLSNIYKEVDAWVDAIIEDYRKDISKKIKGKWTLGINKECIVKLAGAEGINLFNNTSS